MRGFGSQHGDGIVRQGHFGITVVHVLQDICEGCGHFGRSFVVWESFVPVNVSVLIKNGKN